MDELKHLRRLSAVKSNAGVKFLTPAAFPGNHCPLHTALALCANIRGMSTLVIGTAECGTYSRNVIAKSKHADGALHWMYVLDAHEVVFGCRKGVMEAVREMDKAGAEAIMLIATCVPEVIGEDMDGILHELRPQLSARLNTVQMGHFKCNSYPSGYWKTLAALAGMMEPAVAKPNVVNVLGRDPTEEHIPMPALLSALEQRGFRLRLLAPNADIADFAKAPDARLNLVLSPYMNPLAEQMRREFHIPCISLHEIYEVSAVDRLYTSVAEALDIAWGDAFDEQRKQALLLEEQARETLEGIRYVATHRNALAPLPLALYLDALGLEPLLLHIEEFYPDDRKWAKALTEKGLNPLICHMVNDHADAQVLAHLAPALSFGEIPGGAGEIPCVPFLYELYGQIGYERTSALLSRILRVMESAKSRQGGTTHGTS